jgi:hypothetical protein
MTIDHNSTDSKGEFFIATDNITLAKITYSNAGDDKLIIDHTEVDESLKGKGIGYNLVDSVVDYARVKGLKIIPLCPFAKAVFKKRKEYSDVLY